MIEIRQPRERQMLSAKRSRLVLVILALLRMASRRTDNRFTQVPIESCDLNIEFASVQSMDRFPVDLRMALANSELSTDRQKGRPNRLSHIETVVPLI